MVFEVGAMLLGVTEAVYDADCNNRILYGLFCFCLEVSDMMRVGLQVGYDADELLRVALENTAIRRRVSTDLVDTPYEILRFGGLFPQFTALQLVADLYAPLYLGAVILFMSSFDK